MWNDFTPPFERLLPFERVYDPNLQGITSLCRNIQPVVICSNTGDGTTFLRRGRRKVGSSDAWTFQLEIPLYILVLICSRWIFYIFLFWTVWDNIFLLFPGIVQGLSHYCTRFIHPNGGFLAGFLNPQQYLDLPEIFLLGINWRRFPHPQEIQKWEDPGTDKFYNVSCL